MTELPVNFEAEIQLLGGILMNNAAYDAVAGFLTPEMFADDRHGLVYAACAKLIGDGQKATAVTVKSRVTLEGLDAQFLFRLSKAAVTIISAEQHGRIIQECWQKRQMLDIAEQLIQRANDPDSAPPDVAAEISSLLDTSVMDGGKSRRGKTLGEAYDIAMAQNERAWQSPNHVSGLSTGLDHLDKRTGGLHDEELIVWAGRPSMGKSALAYQVLRSVAKSGVPVLMFNLEMSADQLARRDLASETGVSTDRQRRGDFNDLDMISMNTAVYNNRAMPFHLEDEPPYTIAQIRQLSRWYVRKHGVRLICVDYLQLISGPASARLENRVQVITEISMGLKLLARTLHLPVIALSQLSREVEKREDKHPQLSDLRESGSIEQDADVVGLLYREEYYLEREEPKQRDSEGEDAYQTRRARWAKRLDACKDLGEVFIGKQRHGPIGPVFMRWNGERTRFEN